MQSINIFAVANGVGISRDIELLRSALKDHFDVTLTPMFRYQPTKRFDINVHIERFNPRWFETADVNVFVPNQEWFESHWMPHLEKFDLFLTKTRFADTIFKNLGCPTEYVSFTSDDRYIPTVPKDDFHWLHVAGKSIQKQTEIIIRTWQKNPGFPQLTLLQDPKFYKPRMTIKNVNFMYDRLPESTLKELQNSHAVHLCPSETEGFGHYIMEALSCKALVLTTGAPPMNELVTSDRGIYVAPVRQEPMRLSTRFIISEATLEKAVISALVIDDFKRREMGERSRQYFLDNDAFFRTRVVDAITNLVRGKQCPTVV